MKKTIFISFSLGTGSVSDYFLALVENLNKKYQVIIFSDTKTNEAIAVPKDVVIKHWPSTRPTKWVDGVFLYRNIKKYRPSMTISIFGSVNIFLIVGFLCGVKTRIAWIRTLSSQFKQKNILVFRKRLLYKLATNFVTNSNATKEDVNKKFYVPISKIMVLPNSIRDFYSDIQSVNYANIKVITYAGRLHKSKGVEVLIKAFSKICAPFADVKLIIIGSGEEESNLKKLVKDLKLEEFVDFKGNLSRNKVLEMFKSSYLAVVPSHSEAFGYTVIEAMSMKTLIIGANNTGIKEIIRDNNTGLLFETNQVNDLHEKISSALLNPEVRNKLAIEGYNHFKNNYETSGAIKRDLYYFDNLMMHINE
ncbi:glycosyltransferase family 4 protein [Flavobacterium sp. GN10]|uniref:Glycosyltransferase family 4 protein n=1 Tax=Flavobacterium tagetis TaxID=2801336 RepID=A0ABS1KI56_9FLAO|nr:glycosyltransferase family 4 protein [Flavobacterium tagetis]MBL0738897.1 glycosyltransferase family 4 protein [Flavobacterium tagetis]